MPALASLAGMLRIPGTFHVPAVYPTHQFHWLWWDATSPFIQVYGGYSR